MQMRRIEKLFVNSRRHSSRVAARALARVRVLDPNPGERLLDLGCGNGAAVLTLAKELGLQVVGVDLDPHQIDLAQQSPDGTAGAQFLVASATALPFPAQSFELVYTNKTTHHIRDWQRALAESARVLKPGGHLLYADFAAPFGRRFPTRRGVDAAAKAAGLRVQTHTSTPLHYTAVFAKPELSSRSEES